MAQNTSLEGLRSQIVHSYDGRRDGRDQNDFSLGLKDIRVQVEGWSSAGSSMLSTVGTSIGTTGAKLSNWGISVVGSSGSSASTGYFLDYPVPGVYKSLFNPSTGAAIIFSTPLTSSGGLSTAGPFFSSTGSITSTHQTLAFAGKGNNLVLLALTTNLWAAMTPIGSSVSTNIAFS